MDGSFFEWTAVVGVVAILGFLWKVSHDMRRNIDRLSADVRSLGERVARIEGILSVADVRIPSPQQPVPAA